MNSTEILSTYIKKLNHPIKEIRERSLQLLKAKLKLGWELDDELAGARKLLEALLAWFYTPQPSLQREALELLLRTIKTKAGTYIVKDLGIDSILLNLKKVKLKIAEDALEIYEDVIETLRFINSIESDVDVVPHLLLPTSSSESDGGSSSGCYNLGPVHHSSTESSISGGENTGYSLETKESIRVLLFPWVDLCQSDKKTLLLVEDALRLLKSTRRCCRFIRDVFLRDFPPEVFLNRPQIIKSLLTIVEGKNGGRLSEALFVILDVTRALRRRLLQLSTVDFIYQPNLFQEDYKEIDAETNIELEEIVGEHNPSTPFEEDGLVILKQLPAPLYAVDSLLTVLSVMARSVVLFDPVEMTEVIDMRELNICLNLVESLIDLLLDCVNESFWNTDHNAKTYRDISHKSCMVMRALGELLEKYRKSFFEDPERKYHRIAWLRLVFSAQKLMYWCRSSALTPTSLVTALQIAQLDPAIELFYPELSQKIETVLENSKITVNQEYKGKYRELKKLFASMDEAVKFIRYKNLHNSKDVLLCIKNSLPVLEIFQSESFLSDIADILLKKAKDLELNDSDWSVARSVALSLMANKVDWVQVMFYGMLMDMVKSILVGNEDYQKENEKCLTLICDVGILTEICCHGLTSKLKEVKESASEIMLYLLRGRLVLSEGCWWRLLASLLPIFPLLHVHAAHETQLGKAICKSLDYEIAECMGVSTAEVIAGLVRLLFIRCVAVQLDAAHTLLRLLDDDVYLPPKDSLRADVLLSALRRVKSQEFNIDYASSPSKIPQAAGVTQILDVLKQDIVLDENGDIVTRRNLQPTLEPSLRRSTLQQLAVIMRHQELHDIFLQYDGLKVIVAILRMSLMVDDYLAFPECAISCVSVLNSICFASRHDLSKIQDLPSLLLRVILVFPANESSVSMAAQVLAIVAWAGFVLQELDKDRHRVPALPLSVTERVILPFPVNSYWNVSPNGEHSYVEWLLAEEEWRAAIRVRWWCAQSDSRRVLSGALGAESVGPAGPAALRPTPRDVGAARDACPLYACTRALLDLQNATAHRQVTDALNMLESYVYLVPRSSVSRKELSGLPWQHTRRFLCSSPASSRDTALLCSLLQFVIAYMEHVPNTDGTMSWIKQSFIGNELQMISLLSRYELYPQQTAQESIEVTQLHIHIVKVLLRCIVMLECWEDYDCCKLESLLKILIACLNKVDLKNFHMLGYLNELMRCIRYTVNSRHCKLSEDTVLQCLRVVTRTLSGCAAGGGHKGQACRLDALLSLLALLKQIHEEALPVQRWSECFSSEVVGAVLLGVRAARAELRAAALHALAALAHHAQLLPHLMQAIEESSLSQFAVQIVAQRDEANEVRAAAACILCAIASRASPKSDILESDILEQLKQNNFIEHCLEVFVEFCNAKEYKQQIDLNVSLTLLERRSEFEVRAQKCRDMCVTPALKYRARPPPTPTLVTSLADVLHNVSGFTNCPVQKWCENGLYRLLFRCASWSCESASEMNAVRSSTRRALLAVTSHKCVRASLASTNDCLYQLLMSLTPFREGDDNEACYVARSLGISLLGSLLETQAAANSLWRMLRDASTTDFLHLLLQCLESDESELLDASMYCLSQLAQSALHKKHGDQTKDSTCSELYDNVKSPFWEGEGGGGDSARSHDCQPEYMAEELCKALISVYQKLSTDSQKHKPSQDARWQRVCSCLSSILSFSSRSRLYAVHRQLPVLLLASLQAVRDHLSMHGKPAEVIRNANNNLVLGSLYWLLTVMDCSMVECGPAKEMYAEESLTVHLCRLWSWCMMTEQLRHAVMHLLCTFTNDCPKAWSALCTCVGGHSVAGAAAAAAARDADVARRRRALLPLALTALRRAAGHHHCRAILIKSDLLCTVYRLCLRERTGAGAGAWVWAWARTCACVSRHAEGAAALLALRERTAPLHALPRAARAHLLPAIANAAHHHRVTFLQSPDLLELLSGTLLAGDTAEIVSAARAVWALAANHHKAKLVFRSAGVSAAVQTTLQRMQHLPKDAATQRALELLTYTNTVLQSS